MKLYRYSIICFAASFVFLTMIAGTVAAETNYIEGPVYSGFGLNDIIGPNNVDFIEMNGQNFAGFHLDTTNNVSTETLRIYGGDYVFVRTILESGLVYTTQIKDVNYAYTDGDWNGATYGIMGFFGEEYVPLKRTTPDKLAKLLVDCNKSYIMRISQPFDMTGGYAITAKQIDVEGDKVWIELTKDGEYLIDQVVNGNSTWTFKPDVAGEVDVEVLRVYVKAVFQGQVESIALVRGVWLIDYKDILEIDSDDEFGVLEVTDIGSDYLKLTNKNSLTLTRNSVSDIAGGMEFKVEDPYDLKFYLRTEYTEPTDTCPEQKEEPPQDDQPVEVPTSNIYITATILGLVVILGWIRK